MLFNKYSRATEEKQNPICSEIDGKGRRFRCLLNLCTHATPVVTAVCGPFRLRFKIMISVSGRKSRVINKFILFLGALGAVFYPIVISPYLNPEKYKGIQKETRKNIRRQDIQPGNMNIWSDPFAAKPNKNKEE